MIDRETGSWFDRGDPPEGLGDLARQLREVNIEVQEMAFDRDAFTTKVIPAQEHLDLRMIDESLREVIPSYLSGEVVKDPTRHAAELRVTITDPGDAERASQVCAEAARWLEGRTEYAIEHRVLIEERGLEVRRKSIAGRLQIEVWRRFTAQSGGYSVHAAKVHALWFRGASGAPPEKFYAASYTDAGRLVLVVDAATTEGAEQWLSRAVRKTGSLDALAQLLEDMKL